MSIKTSELTSIRSVLSKKSIDLVGAILLAHILVAILVDAIVLALVVLILG